MSGKREPEPDSLLLAFWRLGVKAEEAAIVGDSLRRDIEAGKRLGMLTVYAAYGDRNFFESREGKEEADIVAERPEEILSKLTNMIFPQTLLPYLLSSSSLVAHLRQRRRTF